MLSYIARRLLLMVPVLLGVTLITFMLMHIGPSDPARILVGQRADEATLKAIRASLDLDKPLATQYWIFLKKLFRLDLGQSFKQKRPVTQLIIERIPATFKLATVAMIIAIIIGVSAGIISAVRQNTWLDHLSMGFALFGISAPLYLMGMVLIIIFMHRLGIVEQTGIWDKEWLLTMGDFELSIILPLGLILPAITLGLRPAAMLARMTRSSMLEVIRQDYIRTARSKGLGEKIVILRHALTNALVPVVTIIGMQFAGLLTGAVLTEKVFNWPGLGRLTLQAMLDRDYPLIQGCTLFIALLFVISNLLVDLSYAFLDPRIRYE